MSRTFLLQDDDICNRKLLLCRGGVSPRQDDASRDGAGARIDQHHPVRAAALQLHGQAVSHRDDPGDMRPGRFVECQREGRPAGCPAGP